MGVTRTQLIGVAAAVLAAFPVVAAGGDWHTFDKLVCSDCHTMHNSKNGQPMRYDGSSEPAPHLLRAGSATLLCKACHDGTDPNAPNVYAPTVGDPPGGGFPSDPTGLGQAHDLTGNSVQVTGGSTPVVTGCTTCHDPHGSTNYRNLRPNPSRQAGRSGTAPVVVFQGVKANGTNASKVYTDGNLTYGSGMTQWCMDCHDQYATTPNYHPNDYPDPATVSGGATTNYTWWSTGVFTVRDRVENPTWTATSQGTAVPSTDDSVFCLTCHKAHGSTNPNAMLDVGSSTDPTSLCNQCHNK